MCVSWICCYCNSVTHVIRPMHTYNTHIIRPKLKLRLQLIFQTWTMNPHKLFCLVHVCDSRNGKFLTRNNTITVHEKYMKKKEHEAEHPSNIHNGQCIPRISWWICPMVNVNWIIGIDDFDSWWYYSISFSRRLSNHIKNIKCVFHCIGRRQRWRRRRWQRWRWYVTVTPAKTSAVTLKRTRNWLLMAQRIHNNEHVQEQNDNNRTKKMLLRTI